MADNPLNGKNVNETNELDCLRQIQLDIATLADSTGTGGGSATATNQHAQIVAEQAIQAGIGGPTDVAATAGSTGSLSAKLRLATTQLASLITNTASYVLAAGSAIIGKVGIDQTTPGTTNAVSVATATGAGAVQATSAKQDALLSGITKVGATTVVGITEIDTYVTGASSSHTVLAGALAISISFSSDFTGTVQGATYAASAQGVVLERVAQPGNLLPAMVIVRSAGTFDYYVVTPT